MEPKKENHFDLAAKNVAAQIYIQAVKDHKLVDRMFSESADALMDEIGQIALHSCILAKNFNETISQVDSFADRA